VKFLQRYKEKNPNNKYIHDDKYIYELVKAETKSDNFTKSMAFINIFSKPETPIIIGSDEFWSLFSLKETSELNISWNAPHKYMLSYFNKSFRISRVNLLKEYNVSFKDISYYLENNPSVEDELIDYWYSLAKKVKNRDKLLNIEPYQCVKEYGDNYRREVTNNTKIKKVNILYLFKTKQALDLIEAIHENEFNNATVQEVTSVLLEKAGRKVKINKLNFEEEDISEMKYIYKKYLNPEALIQKKLITRPELETFLELLDFFVTTKLAKRSIKVDCQWTNRWDFELCKEKSVYEIVIIMDYEYQKEETINWLSSVLHVCVNHFLTGEYACKVKDYDIKDYNQQEQFYNFFNDFINSSLLKEKIENNISIKPDVQIKKNKI
jgi:hypothetical protein